MSDNLADFPIVVLEETNSQLVVGKVGLFEFIMPVGNTGLVFTAAMPGRLFKYGTEFSYLVQKYSRLRAASSLVHMGWIRGETFAFLRAALELTVTEVANIYGVTDLTVLEWEANLLEIPISVWNCFSFRVCLADSRDMPSNIDHFRGDLPARLIRVFPNLPMVSQGQDSNPQVHVPCPIPPPSLRQNVYHLGANERSTSLRNRRNWRASSGRVYYFPLGSGNLYQVCRRNRRGVVCR